MPIITLLQVQKKNKERVNVYVDDAFFCGMTLDDVVKQKLRVNLELPESHLAELLTLSNQNFLFNKSLNYLLQSPKTEKQIRDYIYKKEPCPETAAKIIERLKCLNYINDAEYAHNFAISKSTKNGIKMIKSKLYSKGIDKDLAAAATENIENQEELAQDLAAKYMRSKELNLKNLQKLYRFLAGKGFDYDLINTVTEKTKRGE